MPRLFLELLAILLTFHRSITFQGKTNLIYFNFFIYFESYLDFISIPDFLYLVYPFNYLYGKLYHKIIISNIN